MQLCRQVYLPLSKAILQLLSTWSVVWRHLHNLHKSEGDFFHLLRLAAVGSVSMPALRRNLSVPCFKSYMKLFQTRSCLSAAARARLCPCTVRLFTCSSHCFHICKDNFLKSFEDYSRRIAALNDKNTIRFMKKGATNTKNSRSL